MILYIILGGFGTLILFKLGFFKAIWLVIKSVFIFIRYIFRFIFKYLNIGTGDYKEYFRRRNLFKKLQKIHGRDKSM